MPRIMFTGPHGIGKTTTAQQLAKDLGYMFYPSFAGKLAKEMGYDLNESPDAQATYDYQVKLLDQFTVTYQALSFTNVVFDRSPIDFATYMTMQLKGKPQLTPVLRQYQEACFEITNNHCDVLVIPKSDLKEPYDPKGNRPNYDPAGKERYEYTDYVNTFSLYLEPDKVDIIVVPIEYQFQDRIDYIRKKLRLHI